MQKKLRELVDQLNKYGYEYYVLDNPSISDGEYDKLYDELRRLETETGIILEDSPTKRVGGEPIKGFNKHKHINRLYSLDKSLTFDELVAFENRIKKVTSSPFTYTVEYKYDGLTISLTYDKGLFVRATTRGNGVEGEDVTAQVKTIKTFPLKIKYKGLLEVQGEAVIKLSNLKKYNETASETLKNARNAVAGAIRNLDPKETEKRMCELLFYNVKYIQDDIIKTQPQCFEFLKENGFKVYSFLHQVNTIDEVRKIIKIIDIERKNIDYLTDGAVIKVNEYSVREELGYTDKFPRFAMAFKFEAEEVTTTLKNVIWQVGRTCKLTPLVIVEPVELGGATVQKATLNNYGDILRKDVKINARILIRRSNEVIHEILGTTKHTENDIDVEKPTVCPYCNSTLYEDGANIFCPNKNCRPRVIGELVNFASKNGMNIDGFSEMTAGVLLDNFGVSKFSDLYRLDRENLLKLDGFKDKKVDNLLNSIENSKKVELSAFIYALGIDGVGKKTAKDLAKTYKSLDNLKNASVDDLSQVEEIGNILSQNIFDYFHNVENLEEINNLLNLGVEIIESSNEIKSGAFLGEKVVLTGVLSKYKRSDASKIIESLGGEILSSVTKQTTLVIAGEDAGSKLEKAKKLGIKIIDENEFENIINA
ncbi:MAG: NAD-dependent DNA ligase LigA [Clostridia bacterium]|nr:NAD-dependent DNA ligase LigA [Clostridia bacterium]